MISHQYEFLSRSYFWIFAGVVLLKILLAIWVPVTGDEAYFYIWGLFPDYGYYDHPPMIGWWLSLVMQVSDDPLALRMLAVLASILPALGSYLMLRRFHEQRARIVSLLMLFVPIFTIGILITTDTAFILFGLMSIACCQRAIFANSKWLFLLSGVLLGFSFLGKYFAALIGFGFLVHFLLFARDKATGLLFIILGTLPAIGLNLYWNWQHCGYNIMFNLVNRHGDEGLQWINLPLYITSLTYLLMPWVLWYFWKYRATLSKGIRKHQLGVWLTTALLPLGLFLLLSPVARIGLHWIVVFIPGALIGAYFLPLNVLRRLVLFSATFASLHILVVFIILAIPIDRLPDQNRQSDALIYLHPKKVARLFDDYSEDMTFLTSSYSRAAVLSYYSQHYFSVWGDGSHYGRQDDLITDFSKLDDTDMVFFPRRGNIDQDDMSPFFNSLKVKEIEIDGIALKVAEGKSFKYSVYRDKVLSKIRDDYYNFPSWLPLKQCKFISQYQF